mmetsp:Transcript_22795/g.34549  ORF Transcript_22795/g.34549 Transcript_22795/m.34549 type:complete len:353 (-) Transcript_22795:81-1139(-)|eukprot:CAMPEP_0194259754 /NCGR_PEP_ID=MMETSP0158-20130606/44323_1 /TAXON_ID=33649 /ORGANISM="Thalassionema nitzschioides, Strain L26-B" /LENGTH=352 /DNA_ID=CAMNT_0038999673 /DNA_START=102 /DNA_END=1157 /DNA_ORIENTATION=-
MDPGVDLSNEADASSMALAAAEAAAAAEEQEQQLAAKQQEQQQQSEHNDPARQSSLNNESNIQYQELGTNNSSSTQANIDVNIKCRICGKTQQEDPRPVCRFLPAQVDLNTTTVAPGVVTFDQDITVHVFCGKTASILPNVNQPDLEILSKAGIKNKHGIGPEVNGALARTRSSTIHAEGSKEKTFYIVKEFEAHLATIRSASMGAAAAVAAEHRLASTQPQYHHVSPMALDHPGHPVVAHSIEPSMDMYHSTHSPAVTHLSNPQHMAVSCMPKVVPHKVGQSYHKTHPHQRDQWGLAPPDVTITSEGKIRCGCGGTHLPTGTAKGDASWRSHVMTKRHQKWMEENGLLGAV